MTLRSVSVPSGPWLKNSANSSGRADTPDHDVCAQPGIEHRIAFDLPGFGRSPALPPGIAPTAAALADAVERELDRFGVAQFHVAGYSLGARVALELATRGRALSVIAIAPDGLGTPLERVHQAAALMTGRALALLLAPSPPQWRPREPGGRCSSAWSGAVPGCFRR